MADITDLVHVTVEDYCGRILSGDFSAGLKKRVAETIDHYRVFENTGTAALLYIAAWQGDEEKILMKLFMPYH
jgi:hypothetical protein